MPAPRHDPRIGGGDGESHGLTGIYAGHGECLTGGEVILHWWCLSGLLRWRCLRLRLEMSWRGSLPLDLDSTVAGSDGREVESLHGRAGLRIGLDVTVGHGVSGVLTDGARHARHQGGRRGIIGGVRGQMEVHI